MSTPFDPARDLPEVLPDTPFPTILSWFDEAHRLGAQPNPNAMTIATADAAGRPAARVVLCRGIDPDAGSFTFFTNRTSHKGRDLAANSQGGILFHWDHLELQVRAQGPVVESGDAESDNYWNKRRDASKIAAWASDQSAPVKSRDDLQTRLHAVCERFGVDPANPVPSSPIPRPAHWGGYRLHAERVELWAGSPARFHDRAVWTRTLTPRGEGAFEASGWTSTRLQP